MKRDLLISKALFELAEEGVSKHTHPWPIIREKIEEEGKIYKPALRSKFSWALLLVLIALLMLSAVAYAFYRIMMDPGLQAVQNAGLITDKNQPAQPTLFANQTRQKENLAATVTPSIENLKVNLNWAYADEARVAFQITITGLTPEQAAHINNYVCKPYITNDSGVFIDVHIADVSVHANQQWNPVDVTYVAFQQIDAGKHSGLNLSLDITVGPCGPYWNFQEKNLPVITPFPVYGNYHLDFQTPVYRGTRISPGQTDKKNGVEMRLDQVILNPSYIDLRLCYQAPASPTLPAGSGILWTLDGATLEMNEGASTQMSEVLSGPTANSQGDICEIVGYAIPAPANLKASQIKVHVARLVAVENESNLSSQFKEDAKARLAQQGIEVDFESVNSDNTHLWKILKKPDGMTDDEANQEVLNLLIHTIEGPWNFEFNPTP